MSDWRAGDIVLSERGTVLERLTDDPYDHLPRWQQLSPYGGTLEGCDPDNVILLARRVGERRLPVIDLEGMSGKAACYHPNGATWAGNCVDCGKPCAPDLRDVEPDAPDHEPGDSLLPYFGPEDDVA